MIGSVVAAFVVLWAGNASDGRRALVQGHPHLPDGNTEARPVALDVDDELARLVAGEELAPPQPSHGTIATGDG